MAGPIIIGGDRVVSLRSDDKPDGPAFVAAEVAPGRGFMLLNADLRLPSGERVRGVNGPSAEEAARLLDGGPDDFAGNKSFSMGGAILAPYANRVRGRAVPGAREIETEVDGRTVRLPRNWGGRAPGAEQYAMHGLILATPVAFEQTSPDRVEGRLAIGDFDGRWPSRTLMTFEWRLAAGALRLAVRVRNVGHAALPFGLGWHPYFAIPSGRREQARLRLPAVLRTEVDDYDQVLPTGRLLPVEGTPYDFSGPEGRALDNLYLDDCFTALSRDHGRAVVELIDPAAALRLRITSPSRAVKAVQVYAPPGEAFAAIEPQFNLADPFGAVWPSHVATGMVRLPPGAGLSYEVQVEPLTLH